MHIIWYEITSSKHFFRTLWDRLLYISWVLGWVHCVYVYPALCCALMGELTKDEHLAWSINRSANIAILDHLVGAIDNQSKRAGKEEEDRACCVWPIIRWGLQGLRHSALHLQTSNVAARGAEQRKRLVGKSSQQDQDYPGQPCRLVLCAWEVLSALFDISQLLYLTVCMLIWDRKGL